MAGNVAGAIVGRNGWREIDHRWRDVGDALGGSRERDDSVARKWDWGWHPQGRVQSYTNRFGASENGAHKRVKLLFTSSRSLSSFQNRTVRTPRNEPRPSGERVSRAGVFP